MFELSVDWYCFLVDLTLLIGVMIDVKFDRFALLLLLNSVLELLSIDNWFEYC